MSSENNKLPVAPIPKKRVTQIVADDLCPEITDIYNLKNTNSHLPTSRRNSQTAYSFNKHNLTDRPNINKISSANSQTNFFSNLPTLVDLPTLVSNEINNNSKASTSTPTPTVRAIRSARIDVSKSNLQNCKTS